MLALLSKLDVFCLLHLISFLRIITSTRKKFPLFQNLQKKQQLLGGSDVWLTGYNLASSDQRNHFSRYWGLAIGRSRFHILIFKAFWNQKIQNEPFILSSASVRLVRPNLGFSQSCHFEWRCCSDYLL